MAKHKTLGRIEAVWNKLGGEEGVDRFLAGELIVVEKATMQPPSEPKKKPLEFISMVSIPARATPFVARDHFMVNAAEDAAVKISFVEEDFANYFLKSHTGESPTAEFKLMVHRLSKVIVGDSIITELGGEGILEVPLSAVFSLMETQGKGEDGTLLTNRHANIFYVRDRAGALCVVGVRWLHGGWGVHAYPLEFSRKWFPGDQVFFRNS